MSTHEGGEAFMTTEYATLCYIEQVMQAHAMHSVLWPSPGLQLESQSCQIQPLLLQLQS